ncbi:MAG: hypothetical protein M1825_006285 [Sarcosagium campestre]|nr:MAG: hypothetical protein M1825_006285 [Sarcosagium campestre]
MTGRGPPRGRGGRGGGPARGGGGGGGGGGERGRGGGRGGQDRGGPRGRGPAPQFDRGRGGFGSGGPLLFNPGALSPPSKTVAAMEDAKIVRNQALAQKTSIMPLRPGYGTGGRAVILRANYFEIVPRKDLQIFRYHVEVTPEPGAARKRQRAFELFVELAPFLTGIRPAVATDNRSTLVTATMLKLGSSNRMTVDVPYYESEEDGPREPNPVVLQFKVSYSATLSMQELLSYVGSTDLSGAYGEKESVVQAMNIAMMRKPTATSTISVLPGAKRVYPQGAFLADLGSGLIALRGYFTSVRTSTLRLLANVNAITGTFYKPGPLLDTMIAFKNTNGPSLHLLGQFLKGIRVSTKHLKTAKGQYKTRVLAGISLNANGKNGAKDIKFHWDQASGNVTVFEFFKKHHNITLQRVDAPLVNCGNRDHPMWLPPELCDILPGQVAKKKLTPEQTQMMIKVACRQPADNARLIVGEGSDALGIGSNHSDGPTLFGLSIKPEMITVPGRILQPPSVLYGAKKSVNPSDGSWNMVNQKFSVPSALKKWSYCKIQPVGARDSIPPHTSLRDLVQEFAGMMKSCGMQVDPPTSWSQNHELGLELNPRGAKFDPNFDIVDRWMAAMRATYDIRTMFIVLPTKNASMYAHIKYFGDVKHGIATVCSFVDKISSERGRPQYLANVALKMNLKQRGINQQIPPDKLGILCKSKCMVMGIDVTHPSPGSTKGAPSVAGVVASVNDKFGQWPASLRAQESRKEMVSGLEDMIFERLKAYQKVNMNALPQNIIVYRDGVSEGQYNTVLEEESPAFDRAIARLYPAKGPKPKVSIIIVGKRHHTRFYPTKDEDGDRKGNPKNGTVVDRGVTSERHWDFYLQAHTGLQGTTRPAHYIVVQDQIGLGANGLEQLTHNLCYIFGRATKAVSICPPAYYADLLCERARCYLYNVFSGEDSSSVGGSEFNFTTARWTRDVHPDLAESMFYI